MTREELINQAQELTRGLRDAKQEFCGNCGTLLDNFGFCPNAELTPEVSEMGPIYCRNETMIHPAICGCEICVGKMRILN